MKNALRTIGTLAALSGAVACGADEQADSKNTTEALNDAATVYTEGVKRCQDADRSTVAGNVDEWRSGFTYSVHLPETEGSTHELYVKDRKASEVARDWAIDRLGIKGGTGVTSISPTQGGTWPEGVTLYSFRVTSNTSASNLVIDGVQVEWYDDDKEPATLNIDKYQAELAEILQVVGPKMCD